MSRYGTVADSDVESDEDLVSARPSAEVRRGDQDILENEEEADRLLAQDRGLSVGDAREKNRFGSLRAKRRRRKDGRRSRAVEGRELLYEMEEGGHKDSSDSGSSESDRLKLEDSRFASKVGLQHSLNVYPSHVLQTSKPRYRRVAGIHVVIAIAFIGFIFGAIHASRRQTSTLPQTPLSLSNGTHIFAPTTILISLDGFRADFLNRNLTPNLNALIENGVSPQYMLPSFPSVTFPNHFTLVTGLHPESHGVVGNTFWDPEMESEFYYTDPARSMQPRWWTAEPLWETLEYAGVRTAIHMWPGSEAHIGRIEPAYVDHFNSKEPLPNKVSRALGWLDLPGHGEPGANDDTPRPQLIALYVPNVDADGHLYGPNCMEIRSTISSVDTMIGSLRSGLTDRNLTDIVNMVVVSDHGMASTSTDRLIEFDTLLDASLVEHIDGWPLYGLRPKDPNDLMPLYQQLKSEAANNGHFEVYLRDKDMPARYHFSQHPRIAPLWLVPQTGYAIVRTHEYVEAMDTGAFHPKGLHGYDHEHPLMRAIFIARGPAFPHEPGSKLDVFQNIEVYNVVCDSVGVEPKDNNGTIRLPFKTVGKHVGVGTGEVLVDHDGKVVESETENVKLKNATSPAVKANSSIPATTNTQVDDGHLSWWEWVQGKVDGAKDWANHLFEQVDNVTSASASPK